MSSRAVPPPTTSPSANDSSPSSLVDAPELLCQQQIVIPEILYLNFDEPLRVSRAEVWMSAPGSVSFEIYDNNYNKLASDLWVNPPVGSSGHKIFIVPIPQQQRHCRFALKNFNTSAALLITKVKLFGIPGSSPAAQATSTTAKAVPTLAAATLPNQAALSWDNPTSLPGDPEFNRFLHQAGMDVQLCNLFADHKMDMDLFRTFTQQELVDGLHINLGIAKRLILLASKTAPPVPTTQVASNPQASAPPAGSSTTAAHSPYPMASLPQNRPIVHIMEGGEGDIVNSVKIINLKTEHKGAPAIVIEKGGKGKIINEQFIIDAEPSDVSKLTGIMSSPRL